MFEYDSYLARLAEWYYSEEETDEEYQDRIDYLANVECDRRKYEE